ncbi:MAG: polysaccharide biosynthesis tyrosine autokinase [Clostridia bacterium]|nr:polysaccharide biosynthesis tyrosine autokinase [Deltaproteobacteria bacterium]
MDTGALSEASAQELPDDGFDLRAAYGLVMRRRWIFLAVFFATVFFGTLYTLWSPNIYRASARVFIEERTPRVLNQVSEVYEAVPASTWNTTGFYKTQLEIIRSRPIAERVVAMLDLNPGTLVTRLEVASAQDGGAMLNDDPFKGMAPDLRTKLALLNLDKLQLSRERLVEILRAIDVPTMVQGRVQVVQAKESRIVDISLEDTSADHAALFANAVADAYVEYTQDQRFTTNRSAVEWLNNQLTDLRAKLQTSELALHQFKQDNNIVSVSIEDRQSMVAQTLEHMNKTLAETTTKRIELEARRDQVKHALGEGLRLDSLEMIGSSELVKDLKAKEAELKQENAEVTSRYTPEHPRAIAVRERLSTVQSQLEQETRNIYLGTSEELASTQSNERRLREEIETLKGEALELNRKEIEYRRLQREADNNQDLLQVVLKREKEADLSAGLTFNNVRKFEEARVPDRPIRPRVRVNIMIAVVLGLLIGAAVAWLVDRWDNTLKSQQQVEKILAVSFLGIVPTIKTAQDGRGRALDLAARDHFILDNPRSSVAECCRSIRTNLMFMSPEKPKQSLMITSAGPREGKSTFVVNLSYAIAQSGKRVLVIDSDMRKPRLHKSFGVGNDYGLSNLILGETSYEQAIQETNQDNLHVLACGPVPPNPAELLHTDAFSKIFAELMKRYDRIIFDSPPVAALSDALVIGSMVDGVAMVVKAHETRWPTALKAKRRLQGVGCRIYGVVLNDVDLDDRRSSEYYEDYFYYYRQGYGEDEASKKPASA